MTARSTHKYVVAGDVIFRENEQGDFGFYIKSGSVEIWVTRGTEKVVLSQLHTGDVVGEMSAIDCEPRSASATAITDCRLIKFSHKQILARVSDADPVVRRLITALADRMRITNAQITTAFGMHNEKRFLTPDRSGDESMKLDDLGLEVDLNNAIKKNQLELYYQPIVNLQTMKLAGFESLVRWDHPERGFLTPDNFVKLAEKSELILDLTKWVSKTAIQSICDFQIASLKNVEHVDHLFMSINVTGKDIGSLGFVPWIDKLIATTGCTAQSIKLEITESCLIGDLKVAREVLLSLKNIGIGISIDDFGTGYSNFSNLIDFPMSTLKIDRSFVTSKLSLSKNQKIVKMILGLAHELDADVIAEGVESKLDLEFLKRMNCQFGQGYLFAKPMKKVNALSFIENWEENQFNEVSSSKFHYA